MTKPSYEERVARWKKAARSYRSDMLTALGNWRINRERAEAAEAELLRVRGLLQRLEFDVVDGCPFCHRHRLDGHSADCRMAAALSGTPANEAESADIGKLDAADKPGKVNPPPGVQDYENLLKAGSAEAGGEKAAPELNMTRADDGTPQFLWFGGKYYTIEHPECMDALLKAIREFPTTSPTPTDHGAESVHSGKQNTADKSGLLPTQLPKDKS